MVAVPLIFGRLTAEDYSDNVAADPRIDALRARMEVRENPQFTKDYFDPDKRYIGNSLQVSLQGWEQHRQDFDRLPDRAPETARGGHSGLAEQVRGRAGPGNCPPDALSAS
jgi:2-methylcitrate dehydratase PrpD